MSYQRIEDHGIVGDMRTVALVALDGSIDWLCLPSFDSPSIFGAILDDKKGGVFRIGPTTEPAARQQFYLRDANVLVTRFLSPGGTGEITDFMPVWDGPTRLVRRVQVVRGAMAFSAECHPAFNYARDSHQIEDAPQGKRFRSSGLCLDLVSSLPLERRQNGAYSNFVLEEGQAATFIVQLVEASGAPTASVSATETLRLLASTVAHWQTWISRCNYRGRWREMVHRSALTLELLTYEATGAVVAAPTCSLPERIGGGRNWDYRYNWIRDAAFTLYGLVRIGLTDEAVRFMTWLERLCSGLDPEGSLQTLYRIDGRTNLAEETLDHLEGYKGSRPVRIGNAAYRQLQLDIYGALLDAVYLFNKHVNPISIELWKDLRRLVNWVCAKWRNKDNGIWEVRGPRQDFLYSKLMCWVAVDRALRLAEKRSFPAEHDRWLNCRDEIYQDILDHGWNPQCRAFVQSYGSSSLDATSLMMPLVFFMSPTDPMMLNTIAALNRPPAQGGLVTDHMVYRYAVEQTSDGLEGNEGTFNMCSFWLVEALTRAAQADPERLHEASLIFEKMLHRANHLGLYSEETGLCGEALGNFPQAFAHMGVISAAFNLDRALRRLARQDSAR